jgi:hypothetical protein
MLSLKKLRIKKILAVILVLSAFYLFTRDSNGLSSSETSENNKPVSSEVAHTRAYSIQLIKRQALADLKVLSDQKLANYKSLINDPSTKHVERNSRTISNTDRRFLIVEYTNVNLF